MSSADTSAHKTEVLPVDAAKIGEFVFNGSDQSFLEDWGLKLAAGNPDAANLERAAQQLRHSDTPVAFPTETVYGLGADATRSSAVRGIYKAKQRPSDNPLIVHVSSLKQLRRLLDDSSSSQDPIPSIYLPLISKFWPGPLTILLPLPNPSPFAPEVTAALPTVAVRMPSSLLSLALIHVADRPLAAPSANASSKPSPTTAAHVLHDLSGRIATILDGGPCNIGVESTVVDGLSSPPLILRPGTVSLEMLKECEGWEAVKVGYADGPEISCAPRAPGMKYKHYSPNAKVVLVRGGLDLNTVRQYVSSGQILGILRTKNWAQDNLPLKETHRDVSERNGVTEGPKFAGFTHDSATRNLVSVPEAQMSHLELSDVQNHETETLTVWTLGLGDNANKIARTLFSALRELDLHEVDIIFVEAIDDVEEDLTAAVMNRLRKAAEREIETTT